MVPTQAQRVLEERAVPTEPADPGECLDPQIADGGQAVNELRESRQRHRNLIEGLPIGLCRRQPGLEGRFLLANPALFRMLGYESREEFLQAEAADLWEQPADWVELYGKLMADGQVVSQEARLKKRDGTPVWGSVTANVVRNGCGEITHVNALIEDITERKRLESQAAEAQKLEAMGQLAAGIAHEIRTPLQYVENNTQFAQKSFASLVALLREHDELLAEAKVSAKILAKYKAAAEEADLAYLAEELPVAIQQSLEGVHRVVEIVRAMKEFAHPGATEKLPADLNRTIQSTISLARNECKYVAEVKTDLDPELPPVPVLIGDIKQVILNMLVNAADAIEDVVADGKTGKGTIRVSTRRDGDWVEIRIADTGTGIPEEARAGIFDLFFTTKEAGKGTGQGLAISRAIVVEKHGGTIAFETETGKGTTFITRLPINPEVPASEEPRA